MALSPVHSSCSVAPLFQSSQASSSSEASAPALPQAPCELQEAYKAHCLAVIDEEGADNFPLHWAIFNGNIEEVRRLVNRDRIADEIRETYIFIDEVPSSPIEVEEEEINEKLEDLNDTIGGLTPLHMAVMMGDLEVARILLETRHCKLNQEFFGEVTPCHFAAALGNLEMIKLLIEGGVNPLKTEYNGGTYQDVLNQCRPTIDLGAQTVFFEGPMGPTRGDGNSFRAATGAIFLEHDLVMTPIDWFQGWTDPQSPSLSSCMTICPTFDQAIKERYLGFLKKPKPQVHLAHDSKVGYYVRASEIIPPYTIIGEYLGEVNKSKAQAHLEESKRLLKETTAHVSDKEAPYCYSDYPGTAYNISEEINAFEYRGMMAMVASSFPNCITCPVRRVRGQQTRFVVVSIEEIPKGAVLAFDYGAEHRVKRMPYQEMRQDQLEQYFKGKKTEELLGLLDFQKDTESFEEQIFRRGEKDKVKYLVTTPSAALSLALKGIISVTTLKKLFEKQEDMEFHPLMIFTGQPKTFQHLFLERFSSLINFEYFTEEDGRQRKKRLLTDEDRGGLLADIGQKSLLDIFRTINQISDHFWHRSSERDSPESPEI